MQIACGSQCCSCSVGTEPQFYKDEYGIRYLKTDKGNPVAVTADRRGNIMMVDQAGNLYYDAGSPQLGIYMVRAHAACMHSITPHHCQLIKQHILYVTVNVLNKLFLISYHMLEDIVGQKFVNMQSKCFCHIAVLLCAANYTVLLISDCFK